MPDFPGTFKPPRLTTAPATPVVGQMYYNTTDNTLYWWNNAAWVSASGGAAAANPPLVSALPGSPVDGQEIYYQTPTMATTGVIWHFRYRSASANARKWEFVGGGYLSEYIDTLESVPSTTYVNMAGAGPSVTIPLLGDYEMVYGSRMTGAPTTGYIWYTSPKIGAAATSDTNAIIVAGGASASGASVSHAAARSREFVAVAASTAIILQYKVTGFTMLCDLRWLRVRPIRV